MYENNTIIGNVIKGEQIARTLDIPTINIQVISTKEDSYVLQPGVYAGLCKIKEDIYASSIYIHPSTTLCDKCNQQETFKIEIHILQSSNFSIPINEKVECKCLHFVRDVLDFNNLSLQDIKLQLHEDIKKCINYFSD